MAHTSTSARSRAARPRPATVGAARASWRPSRDLPLGVAAESLDELHTFRALMAGDGHRVQIARLCFDRLYAYEQIALAHASDNPALRALALRLFQACHGDPHARAGGVDRG